MKHALPTLAGLLLLNLPLSAADFPKPISLSSWSATEHSEAVPRFPAIRQDRAFLEEILPSLFTRTLEIDCSKLPAEGVKWVFTGPRAGITITIRPGEVEMTARYSDSSALYPDEVLGGGGKAARFPEKQRPLCKIPYEGALQALTLEIDHRAAAELFLNGKSVHRAHFPEDLSRHQLQLGKERPEWQILRPLARPARITVTPGQRHQQILGWGGITSPNSYQLLSDTGKEQWWKLLAEYGLNIQREYPAGRTLEEGYTNLGSPHAAIHHTYADNFPNGETSDFDYLRRHRRLPNSSVWFEYWWQLPLWTKGNPGEYAKSMITYCRRLKETTGREPEIVGVQNEHRDPQWKQQILALRQQLDQAGFRATRIHMNNHGTMGEGMEWLRDYRNDPEAWKALDFTASNQYDYQDHFSDPDRFDPTLRTWRELSGDKPYLSTELCVNYSGWQLRSYRLALLMAQQYHKTLTITDASAIAYCWLLLDVEQPSFTWSRTLFSVDKENGFIPTAPSHQLRCYGVYSRRIITGMTRVAADSADPDLLVSAFTGEGGKATVVIINRSLQPRDVTLSGLATPLTTAERTSATQPNLIDLTFDPAASVFIHPGEILTLTNAPLGLTSEAP